MKQNFEDDDFIDVKIMIAYFIVITAIALIVRSDYLRSVGRYTTKVNLKH